MWKEKKKTGISLAQLSFTEVVISFSTWQVEQKRIGKGDLCICCTVSQTYGRGGELLRLPLLLRYMLYNTDISGKVDPDRVQMSCGCNTEYLG